jgi:glycosyltransferase involved in cell wall biosynthesis
LRQQASLEQLVSKASFWKPDYVHPSSPSAWLEHAPFAFWLVDALRPTTFVELGTHTGFSYLCLCQAVARLEIPSKGFAVDTWEGDEQTGFYGDEVLTELAAYHDSRYSAFSRLMRMTFDQAVANFSDGSIDLLHIDGLHTYDAVRHDFGTWRPKLSPRGVVLLHDTNVRERGFGVYRLWAELQAEHAGFEFVHGHGLGALGVGTELPSRVTQLLDAEANPGLTAEIRQAYARLGAAIKLEFELGGARDTEVAALEERLVAREGEFQELNARLAALEERLQESAARAEVLEHELSVLQSSESWRVTAPLRFLGSRSRSLATKMEAAAGPKVGVDQGGHSHPRQLLVRIAKPLVPPRMRRSLHQRFPTAIEALMKPPNLKPIRPAARRRLSSVPGAPIETVGSYVPAVGLLPWFNPLNLRASQVRADNPRLNVLLPGLGMRHMSGGPNTAIVFALELAREGVPIRFFSTDAHPDPDPARFWRHARGLMGTKRLPARLELVSAYERSRPVEIGENDVFLATAWWTAQQAKYAVQLTHQPTFLYFIQDFEPLFMPASSSYALAVETYSLDHVPIINTSLLHEFLVAHEIGRFADPFHAASALVFEPALDRKLFHPRVTARGEGPRRLLLYARPTKGLRNLFELGVAALQKAIVEGVLNPEKWEFWGIGEAFSPVNLGGGAKLRRAPWQDLAGYAVQLRESDVLLSCMLSPHPSYPPLEMAASGGLVVTTEYANKTGDRLARLSRNIIGVPPTIEALGAGLAEAVRRLDDWDGRRLGANVALPQSWTEAMAPVVPAAIERLAWLQRAPSLPSSPALPLGSRIAPGFRQWPRNRLDVHRRSAVVRRRAEYRPRPEQEFLSFLTPVWNTDPSFLEMLAESILGQDGDEIGFEWVIVDNASTRQKTVDLLGRLTCDSRVRLHRSSTNLGIVGGLRSCLERASYRYIATVDHDDFVTPDCVRVVAASLQEAEYPLLAYTDEDKLDARELRDPYLKPAWDPVLFANHAYIAHLGIIDRKAALELGAYTDSASEGSHDWDTFVRFINAGHLPLHIPELLYTWRMHDESTAANILSKPVVFESQRNVIRKLLAASENPERYYVEPSPLFRGTPDWRIRRTSGAPSAITTVVIGNGSAPVFNVDRQVPHELVRLDQAKWRESLTALAECCAREGRFVHVLWTDTTIEDSSWPWEAMTHFELFPDTAMIGGRIHRGGRILEAGSYFGFGNGCETPDRGRSLDDPGYVVQMWKQHSVSAVSSHHAVIEPSFLRDALAVLPAEASLAYLGPWLGGIAREKGRRVVYSPFFNASTTLDLATRVTDVERAVFRRAFATAPEKRYLSRHVGLSQETAYQPVSQDVRTQHLVAAERIASYSQWLAVDRVARGLQAALRPAEATGSILTCVYRRSRADFFEALAESVYAQTLPITEWVITVDGPIPRELEAAIDRCARDPRVRVVRQTARRGIIASLRTGLESATGEFVLPVDADDVLAPDAWQVLAGTLMRSAADYVYSDEDVLGQKGSASPYLRPDYDGVLNLESPYIWHLSAFRREIALGLGAYTDPTAELCHDYDTSVRFGLAGRRFAHAPHVLYHWRTHGSSQSHSGRQNPGSIDSVRAVLRRVIETSATPHRYEVRPFPIDRGAQELYIARRHLDIPAITAVQLRSGSPGSDTSHASPLPEERLSGGIPVAPTDAVLSALPGVLASPAEYVLVIDASAEPLCSRSLREAAKLFELHADVVIVSGRLVDCRDRVVRSGWVLDEWGGLVAPYDAMMRADPGPWAIALKAQSIASPVEGLFLVREAFLREMADAVPPDLPWRELGAWLGGHAFAAGQRVAYSPLVETRTAQLGRLVGMRSAEELSWRWRCGARRRADSHAWPILGNSSFIRFERAMGRFAG